MHWSVCSSLLWCRLIAAMIYSALWIDLWWRGTSQCLPPLFKISVVCNISGLYHYAGRCDRHSSACDCSHSLFSLTVHIVYSGRNTFQKHKPNPTQVVLVGFVSLAMIIYLLFIPCSWLPAREKKKSLPCPRVIFKQPWHTWWHYRHSGFNPFRPNVSSGKRWWAAQRPLALLI